MKVSNKVVAVVSIVLGLAGCASPTVVIEPVFPAPATPPVAGRGSVQLVMEGTETTAQLSRYEERGEKTMIGKSDSLGVHLSDFWVNDPPPVIMKRMLEKNLKTWGYQVAENPQPIQLRARVAKFSLDSRAISMVEFQADGVIEVDLVVLRDGAQTYKGQYSGTCTFRTATQIPNKENMDKLFNQCAREFQKTLDADNMLRAALSSN
jgi:uncharacterized lipoprotein YajG